MDKSRIIALFDQDQRIDVEYPGMRREVRPGVVRGVNTSGAGDGMVIYSHLDEGNVEKTIRAQVAYFENIGQDFEWKVYDYDQPPDLKDRLEAHGFTIEEAEALLVLDLEDAPEILWQPVRHNIQRIISPEKIAVILSIEQQVWDEDFSDLGNYLREALTNYPKQMSVYVAYMDGQPVSTAWIYFPVHSQFGSLWGGASLSGYRKQGLYTALLAVRAQEAKTRNVRYLTVDASPMSRPILEKFGFTMIAYTYPCKWKARVQKTE
jgi:GNAT superfamily N-acetyltransferase